jgi:two-component system CheB/CheR fusion protein
MNRSLMNEIVERRRLEDALVEADHRKDEFLAMLAHELRNPLAPILNAVAFMRLRILDDPELSWCRDVIGRQAEHLTRLVEDLLDVSRITQGKVHLKKAMLALDTVVARAIETSRPLIDARRHKLEIRQPARPVHVSGDVTRLAQIVANVLNNAAKYTEEGGSILVTVETQPRSDGAEEALIRVRDSGIGIPREMLTRVFDLFTQVERPLDRGQGGLGIGLALVRRLTELHGGRVEAHSDGPGRGSEFVIALPVLTETATAGEDGDGRGAAGTLAALPARASGAAASGFRVLVVDDNHDSAKSMALLLREMGHVVALAFGGLEGVQATSTFDPDLVFLDLGMPELDGFETARRIRALPERRTTLVVALTGYGQDEDRRRSKEAGFDHHLVKPVGRRDLEALIERFTASRTVGDVELIPHSPAHSSETARA